MKPIQWRHIFDRAAFCAIQSFQRFGIHQEEILLPVGRASTTIPPQGRGLATQQRCRKHCKHQFVYIRSLSSVPPYSPSLFSFLLFRLLSLYPNHTIPAGLLELFITLCVVNQTPERSIYCTVETFTGNSKYRHILSRHKTLVE